MDIRDSDFSGTHYCSISCGACLSYAEVSRTPLDGTGSPSKAHPLIYDQLLPFTGSGSEASVAFYYRGDIPTHRWRLASYSELYKFEPG